MKPLLACGLATIVVCLAFGLLVNPLTVLIPVVFFAFVLFLRFPEAAALLAVGAGMLLSQIQMMDLGFPSVGLNLLDFVMALMLLVVVFRWRKVQEALSARPLVRGLIWFVAAAGVVALLKGILEGYLLRTALRGFRFYFYTVVAFHFALLFGKLRQVRTVVIGWMLFAPAQLYLLATEKVIYHQHNPGKSVLAPDISSTATHYLPIKSFFPMMFAVALLALASRHLRLAVRVGLWVLIASQIVVLAFSYSRALYIGALGGLVAALVGTMMSTLRDRRNFLLNGAHALRVALGLVCICGAGFWVAGSLARMDIQSSLENVQDRLLFARVLKHDQAILGRLEGYQIGWSDIRRDPLFGTGLGDSAADIRAEVFHNGWLWIAVSAGLPAALASLAAVGLVCVKTLKTLHRSPESEVLSGLRLGLLASLVMWSLSATSSTSMMDLTDVFDWGFLMGLVTVWLPPKPLLETSGETGALRIAAHTR